MPQSALRLFKNAAVHWPRSEKGRILDNTRGIYFLYDERPGGRMNTVYVGIARGGRTGIKGRLFKHGSDWTHFSAYEVWDNIGAQEIEELEAFFLAAYAKDEHANRLNKIKGNSALKGVQRQTKSNWPIKKSRAKRS